MQEVRPFRGLRYNLDKVVLEDVVSPPYDVISKKAKRVLLERSPYNVVRLILPQGVMGDDKYAQANIYLTKWKKEGIFLRDEKPSFYVLEERFVHQGEEKTRIGFIGLLRLAEIGKGIYSHEKTVKKVKKDRLKLLEFCRANLSQIFMLYRDPDFVLEDLFEEVKKKSPDAYIKDDEGCQRSMWIISEEDMINKISSFMKDKELIIADGHHRYETALEFKKMMGDGEGPHQFVMAYFTNALGEGTVSYPTHRVLKEVDREEYYSFVEKIKELFEIEEIPYSKGDEYKAEKEFLFRLKVETSKTPSVGMIASFERKFYIIKFTPEGLEKAGIDPRKPIIDVVILDKFILPELLNISREKLEKMEAAKCTHNVYKAIDSVISGRYQLAFILNPLPLNTIVESAIRGELLPQKSTYFYPKLLTGLVIRDFED